MTNIKDILNTLSEVVDLNRFGIETSAKKPAKAWDDVENAKQQAQTQLQKAFEEAVEEIIGEDVEEYRKIDLQGCGYYHQELENQLKATQRTKAKQVIKEMFHG